MYNVKLTLNELVDLRVLLQKVIKETQEEIETYSKAISKCEENDSKHITLYTKCIYACYSDIESAKTILEKLYNVYNA